MMNSKKIFLISLLVIICICYLAYAEEIVRTITITDSDRIINVSIGNHYFSVIYKNKNHIDFTNLYSNKGELLFSKGKYNGRESIPFSKAVESMDLFFIHYQGFEYFPDLLVAFDIKTGDRKWETEFFAGFCEISPSGNYFITCSPREDNQKSPFRIINLNDGNFIDFPIELEYYHATWLDSIRVIIAFNENKELDNIQDIEEYRKYDDLQGELSRLRVKLGRIPKSELEKNKRYQEIKQEIDRLVEKNPIFAPEGRIETLRLIVYNVKMKKMENSKYIYAQNGEKIPNIHQIRTDENGNIYILKLQANFDKVCLIKLNSNLDAIWYREGKDYLNFKKIIYGDRTIFRTSHRDSYFILDQESGGLMSVDEFKKSDTSLDNIDLKINHPHYLTLEINPKIKVDYTKNTILIKGVNNEE